MKIHVDAKYDPNLQKFATTISPSADGRFRGFESPTIFDTYSMALRGGLKYLEKIGAPINWDTEELFLL